MPLYLKLNTEAKHENQLAVFMLGFLSYLCHTRKALIINAINIEYSLQHHEERKEEHNNYRHCNPTDNTAY